MWEVRERLAMLVAKLKARRKQLAVFALIVIFMSNSAHPVAAESFTDKITGAIGGLFSSIVDGIKSVFSMIFDAITWPFRAFNSAMMYTWDWSREHLGPLGVIALLAIGGAAIYLIIYWVMQYKQQILNN